MIQVATKISSLNKINYPILQIIWSWDNSQITSMIYHAIYLDYNSIKQNKTWEMLLDKERKHNFKLVRSY